MKKEKMKIIGRLPESVIYRPYKSPKGSGVTITYRSEKYFTLGKAYHPAAMFSVQEIPEEPGLTFFFLLPDDGDRFRTVPVDEFMARRSSKRKESVSRS